MIVDLSLRNTELYAGCEIEEVAGRLNLVTPAADAVAVVGRNIERLISALPAVERDECVLTGPMAIWAYLVVFHAVVHRFGSVKYDDGRTGPVLILIVGSLAAAGRARRFPCCDASGCESVIACSTGSPGSSAR